MEKLLKDNHYHTYSLIKCSVCNKEMRVRDDYIKKHSGVCLSCQMKGEHRAEKHGDYKKRLYNIWWGMIGRCANPNNTSYANYGAKGIKVCDEWKQYLSFKTWAISHGYNYVLTIDRIDNAGNYCPQNCRWITREENARRARQIFSKQERKNIFIERKRLNLTQRQMAKKLNVSRNTIQRIDKEFKYDYK